MKLSAIRIDLASGEADPPIELFTVAKPPAIHGLNSFASPTPVIADGRVVCHFGAMGTACIDAKSGAVLWRRRFEIDHIVGPGSSPIIHKGRAILTCDGGDKQFIVAVDLKTGDDAWRVDRPPMREENPDLKKAYCTPLIYTAGGREQMVIPGAQWFIAYDPSTGEEICASIMALGTRTCRRRCSTAKRCISTRALTRASCGRCASTGRAT